MAHKWGAADSLDSNHTYKDVPPIFNNGPRIEELSGVVFHPVHASVFIGPNPSSGQNNLDGATYSYSSSRVFTGSKGLLAHTGDSHNIQLSNTNADIQNWNHFPAFSGGNNFMTAISGSFLATSTGNYTFRWSNDDAGAMYIDLDHDGTFAASESLAPFAWDGSGTLELVAGTVYNFFYMTAEGGGGDTNNWYVTQPGGSEERVNLGKPSQIAMWSAPSVDAILTTGKPISLQVPASRNPTSWTATGLASGLSINNSGVITGSTGFIGDFNATFTAINSDGNDSKTFSFNVIKGRRVIDWNQTIAGKSYGDAPFALTATKTGTDISLANFPNTLPGMKLWLDASSLSSAGSTWTDKSPADNDATKVGSPSVATNAQNGLSVMSYSGATSESHAFTTITDIRTVFWVVSEDSSVSGSGLRYLLGDTVEPDWHTQGDGNIWGHQWGESKVYNGYTRLNGVPIDGRVTAKPTSLSILTIRTTSNARATSFSNDRNSANRSWKGKLGELLIFNSPLDDDQMQRMEGYLAQKWGLTSSLPSNHPYLTVSPAAFRYSSSDPEIIDINGSTAIIKSGGSVVITAHAPANTSAHSAIPVSQSVSIAKAPLTITGDDLTITQGTSIPDLNYTISGWKHNDSSLAIPANPAGLNNLALWLDASDENSITHATNAISQWNDKSGNNKHATQSTADNKPTLTSSVLNGKSIISFDGSNDYLTASSLNISQPYSIFAVAKTIGGAGRDYVFDGVTDNNKRSLVALKGNNSGKVESWAGSWGNSNINTPSNYFTLSSVFNSSSGLIGIDGTVVSNLNTSTRNLSGGIRIGANYLANGDFLAGDIAEFLIVDAAVSTSDRQAIEGYLAHKWGLQGNLPSNHSHKIVALTRGPIVTTDANNSSAAGTYYVRPSDAASQKYAISYVDGQLIKSNKTEQTIAWGQDFSSYGVNQYIDLNASVASGLPVTYSLSDATVAELAVTMQSSLQGWWKMDELSGSTMNDSSGNSRTGVIPTSSSALGSSGKFGNAFALNGSNVYAYTSGFKGITGGDRRTIALWFKTSTANKPILQYGAAGTATLFKLSLNSSGAAVLDLGGTTITTSTTGLANGAWHHLAATIPASGNTGGTKLYVNGSATNGSGSTAINTSNANDLKIGTDGSAYFNGLLDDVRFYGAELNSTLITQLYGSGNGDFNRIYVKAAGNVTITANQQGNNSYAPAPAVTIAASFDKSDQTISFSPIADKSVGDFDFSPTAVASSGLPVSFASSDSLVAEIQGTAPNQTIKIRAAGTATITASQIGDSGYNAATNVTQTVTVGYYNLQSDSFPGLRLWVDGNNLDGDTTEDIVANGSNVTQWIDRSGNNNHPGQGTNANKPTYAENALNGMGVVRFTAAQSFNISTSNDFVTVVAVLKQASNQTAETKPLGSNIFATTAAGKFGLKRQGSAWMDSGVSSQTSALLTMQLSAGNYALFVNGVNKGTGTDPIAPDSATKLGNDFAGDIAELVAYSSVLNSGVRQKVEGYLAHKWGLDSDLPSSHTYKVGKPAFGGAQVLTFQPVPDKQVGQTVTLDVSSDSGLSVFTYDSNDSSVVSFSGNVATPLKVGKVTITATQGGQAPWLSATATQPFIVTATPRVDQTITFTDIPDKTVQSANFELNATASSGLPVSFTVVSGTSATVESNGTVTIAGAGVTTIRASQDGNGSYNPALTVEKTLTVNKVTQTITFNSLSSASLSAGTYELNATASSGLSVSFTSDDTTVAEVSGNTLTLKKGGTITITAIQGGNGTYLAASDATRSLTVLDDTQQAQTITWSQNLSGLTVDSSDTNMTASASSNLTVSYLSSNTNVATVVNNTYLHVVGAGSATISAIQAGNGQWQAAPTVEKTITLSKAGQRIVTDSNQTSLPNLTIDNGDFEFAPALKSAKTSSFASTGLALTFSSSHANIVEITGGGTRLKPKGDGTATITASQPGSAIYNPASSKTFTVTVTEKSPYSDSLPGMILWLDANDINADGLAESNTDFISNGQKSQASAWADRSGSSNTLSQGTTNLQPVRVVSSGKPGLAFGSTQGNAGAHMTATMPAILSGNPSFTLFAAVKTAGTQPEKILHFGNSAGTAGQVLGMAKNGGYYFNGGGELSFPSVNFGGNVQVGVFRRKASATYADGEFFFNGTTQIGSAQSGTSVPAIPSSGTREVILGAGRTGTSAIGNQLSNAVVHEVMLFSGSLTDFAIRRMEGYLAHKWGSNARLVAGHPFESTQPLFGGSQSISLNPTNVPTDSSDNVPFMSIFDSAFDLEGTYATSGLALSYESNDTSILSVTSAGLLQPHGQGLVRITARQTGNSYFSAATPATFNMKILGKRSQTVTFTTPSEVRIDQPLDLNATASSGLDANFSIASGGSIASLSGNRLTFSGTGSVTVRSGQAGDSTYAPANYVNRTFLVKRPLAFVFDNIGDMGMGQSFTVKAVVLDGITNQPVQVNPTYSIVSGVATISGNQITCGSSTGTVTVRAVATGSQYFTSSADKTFNVTNKQGQSIFFKQGEKGGLRDLPLSRKPVPIGRMATATSNLAITYSLTANPGNVFQLNGNGADAILVFNKNFTSSIPDAGLTVQITAAQAGNGSYNAAASVVREITVKKPGKSAFFDERRLDPRYEKERTKFARKLAAKKDLKGLIDLNGDGSVNALDAELMFDSDDTDSDGDGMSNFMERAFGGDSLSSDAKSVLPRSVNKKDGKQRITFQKYQDTYNSEGIEYIVETSSDLRTWTTTGVTQVDLNGAGTAGKGMNAGGGMERVLYETSGTAASKGGKQFLRVRLRTK